MLDNLVNADLSGLTGRILYSYDSASMIAPQMMTSIGAIIFLLAIVLGAISILSPSKTKRYREQLVDMYVSATVRKFAKDDGLDLEEEYKTFMDKSKKEKLKTTGLSDVVEDELSEKVIQKQEKKLNKK